MKSNKKNYLSKFEIKNAEPLKVKRKTKKIERKKAKEKLVYRPFDENSYWKKKKKPSQKC